MSGNFAPIRSVAHPEFDVDDIHYVQVYERRRQPDNAGAHAFAFETYGLMETTPIGPGVARRQYVSGIVPVTVQNPMVVTQPAGFTTGIPIMSGGIYGQPLVDANGNLINSLAPDGAPSWVGWNTASSTAHMSSYSYNQPFPYGY